MLLLLVLALLPGAGGAGPSITAFWAAWEALERARPSQAEPEVRRVAGAAATLLSGRGVRWHASLDEPDVLVMVPLRTGSAFNDLAWRLAGELDGLAVVFDARRLKEEEAGALYDEDRHRLVLSPQEIAQGRVSDYVEHELVHARNLVALARGADNLFMGWVRRTEQGRHLHPSYPDRFSLDELQAYAQQARANLRELGRVDGHGDHAGTIEMIEAGSELARVAAEVGARATRLAAQLLATRPLPPAAKEEHLVAGRTITATVLRGIDGSVRFEAGALPPWVHAPPPIRRAIVEMGGAELEFIVPATRFTGGPRSDLRLVQQRAERLAACAQAIAKALDAVRLRLEADDIAAAIDAMRALRRPTLPSATVVSCR